VLTAALASVVAHAGRPLEPHDLWRAWNLDPLVVGGLVLAGWAYQRGWSAGGPRRRRPGDAWRARGFAGALVTLAVALVSPLDALAGALASAHMVQHVLLVLVVAPLLALSAPFAVLLRASPRVVRAAVRRGRVSFGRRWHRLGLLREPVALWLAHVVVLWFWHAAVPYDAALDHRALHVTEHATFLVTGVLFWRVVVGRRAVGRVAPGFGVLLVFAMALQSVFLAALLTFASSPWYSAYTTTTAAWGLEPLADQQLAGAIMWIPAGLVYVGAGLALVVTWVRSTEAGAEADPWVLRPADR
jgi:putative membrane protein